MKVLPFKIPKADKQSILFQNDRNKIPYNKLHQHEEFQITLVEKGTGNMIVGDSFRNFNPGEIFFIGKHLPHVFSSSDPCSMVSIFFTNDVLGSPFFNLPQLNSLNELLKSTSKGVIIDSLKNRVAELVYACERNKGSHQVISFLQLLQTISDASKSYLSQFSYDKQYSPNEAKRMTAVFDFALNNYSKEIRLDEVASLAMMSKNAFCKYFKQRTNKSYFNFLIEVRIEKACELLRVNHTIGIEEIGHIVGFNNQSNFNRQFKKHKGKSPSEFRKSIHQRY